MTPKQRRFADEYLINTNGTQAAIRAGYSKKSARQIADQLLSKLDIRQYIDERLEQIASENIADAIEVIKYLTSVLRGESSSEYIVIEGQGDGVSEARRIKKAPDEKDRLKAAELLGKRYGMFTDKMNIDNAVPVVIFGDELLED